MNTSFSAPVGTDFNCIEITNDTIGHVFLSIEDDAAPLWHGPYQGGKLSVYKAAVDGEPKCVFIPLIYIITNVIKADYQYVGYSCYGAESNITKAVNALLADIHDTVLRVTMDQKASDDPTIH